MELTEVAHALSSQTRVRLLQIALDMPVSSAEAFEQYQAEYESPSRRESIYRELENLAEAGLLEKRYESEDKELVYAGRGDIVRLDVVRESVSLDN
jgi:Fe2+ or Zn2+ uptake regulation protein